MGKIIIAGSHLSDAGTLEDSSALAANYPVSNLLDLQPGRKARFSTPGAAHIVLDLGSAQAITLAMLGAHNGSAAGTWRVRGATSEANLTAAPGFDSGAGVSLWPATGKAEADVQHSFINFSAETYRWWRIDVADAGNADGYFEAGRIILANAWAPAVNFGYGAGIGWIDPSPIDQGVAGHMHPLGRPGHRVMTLPFRLLSEADALGGLYELERLLGARRDVFAVLDKEDTTQLHRRMMHGLMRGTTAPLSIEFFKRYGTNLRIQELVA